MGRAAPQRLACRVGATPPGREKPQRSMPSFCNRVEYCEVKPVSEFLQTHGPGKLRHRPHPLLPSLSQTLPTSFTPLRDRKRRRPCTVKKISGHQHTIPIDRCVCATDVRRLVIQRQEFVISRQEVPQTACVQQLPNGEPYQIASGGRPPGAMGDIAGDRRVSGGCFPHRAY